MTDARENLQEGQEFDNEVLVKSYMSQYNKDNFTEFKVASNGKKLLVYECKHGVHRLCHKQRPKTSSALQLLGV